MRLFRYSPQRQILLATSLVVLISTAPAQTSQTASSNRKQTTYVDGSFGFQLAIPSGWRLDRARFTTIDGAIGVAQAASPDASRSFQIAVYRSGEPIPFADWIERFANRMRTVEGTARIRGDRRPGPTGDGYQLTIEGDSGGTTTIRRHFCVPFDPNTVWVLSFISIHEKTDIHDVANREYETSVTSLGITYTPESKEAMNAALRRGKEIVDDLPNVGPRCTFDAGIHYYITEAENGPTGYFSSQVDRTTKDGKPGLRLRERAWQFAPDGTVSLTRTDAFSSFDGRTELIETQTSTLAPPARSNTPDRGIVIALDQCVREGDSIFSSYSVSNRPTEQTSRAPIKVGPVYLPFAWTRLMPVLAGNTPGEPVGFVVYDPLIRGLATRTIRCTGEKRCPPENHSYRSFDVTEGYALQPVTLFCEPTGVLHYFSSGPVTVRAASAEEVERHYKARRQDAEKRLGR